MKQLVSEVDLMKQDISLLRENERLRKPSRNETIQAELTKKKAETRLKKFTKLTDQRVKAELLVELAIKDHASLK